MERLNRELVSRRIYLDYERRERRTERSNLEFESRARSRILTGGRSSLTLHSPSLHYYRVTNPLTSPSRSQWLKFYAALPPSLMTSYRGSDSLAIHHHLRCGRCDHHPVVEPSLPDPSTPAISPHQLTFRPVTLPRARCSFLGPSKQGGEIFTAAAGLLICRRQPCRKKGRQWRGGGRVKLLQSH